jgi:hypothetical protein
MPYADRAFSDECAPSFDALPAKNIEFCAKALAIRRITVHLDAVHERTLFA